MVKQEVGFIFFGGALLILILGLVFFPTHVDPDGDCFDSNQNRIDGLHCAVVEEDVEGGNWILIFTALTIFFIGVYILFTGEGE